MSDKEIIKKYVDEDNWEESFKKLDEGYPVQYIVGSTEFYGFPIKVDERVLIPRFETEYLVEKTINYLNKLNMNNIKVLEIGTGSGCISIALKKLIECSIDAMDISKDALDLAMINANMNEVNINFVNEDINNYNSNEKYDLIISNPPYVPYNSQTYNIEHEPKLAIYAKDEGIYFYKVILSKIKNNLANNYLISFEIGDKEFEKIKKICNQLLPDAYIKLEYDLNNYERYVFISNKNIF